MSIKVKNIAYFSVILSLMSLPPCRASQPPHQISAFDGTWWLSISEDERSGFVRGYLECYTNEFKGPDSYSNSFDGYAAMITKRYQSNPSGDKRSVVHEIHEMRDEPGKNIVDPYGEPMTAPTGLEWMQMDAIAESNSEPLGVDQRGFVEGYLACLAELNHNKGGVFSKSADTYVNDIDHWYGYVASTGDMNPGREDTPIADVLFKFADKHWPSKTGGN